MTPAERADGIRRYEEGPALLAAALDATPVGALQWRPAPGRWSVHEVIVHCGDSETNSHMRLRYLLGEASPAILGYDQDRWATSMEYHAHPIAPAMAAVAAVRANTTPLLRRLREEQWHRAGQHTESGGYGVEDWLQIYAEHLEIHDRQIRRNIAAWEHRSA